VFLNKWFDGCRYALGACRFVVEVECEDREVERGDRAAVAISSLACLADRLGVLTLNLARLADVSALAACTELRRLNLNHTQVWDISALAGCTALKVLGLAKSQVVDVSALAACTALLTLNLEGTQVVDVARIRTWPWRSDRCYPHSQSTLAGGPPVCASSGKGAGSA
jgi:hypothetical protein